MPRGRRPAVTLTIHRGTKDALKNVEIETTIHKDDYFTKKMMKEIYSSTIDGAINLKDEKTDEYIAGPFMKLPPKRQFPDYYDIISQPISLHEIQIKANPRKTKSADLPTLYEFVQYFKLMSDNAASYNGADSLIAKDAHHLFEFAKIHCEKFAEENRKERPSSKDDNIAVKAESSGDESSTANTEAELTTSPVKPSEEYSASDLFEQKDHTSNLNKILRSVIAFRSSHHKNSLKLSIPFMNPVDGNEYPDYYKVIKKGMCFNDVAENLKAGRYKNGAAGIQSFRDDVELIFLNATTYNAAGSAIYRDALTLKTYFQKKMDKFGLQGKVTDDIVEQEPAVSKPKKQEEEKKPKLKRKIVIPDSIFPFPKRRGRKSNKQKQIEAQIKAEYLRRHAEGASEEDFPTDEIISQIEEDYTTSGKVEQTTAPPQTVVAAPPPIIAQDAIPFIRKHDIEKAKNVEAVDDITAFIKRFTFSSAVRQYSSYSSDVTEYFEHCMIEPAGNSTIGGSTYSITIPAEEIIGQPLIVLVSLQNRIIDEKYTTELKVNKEILKPQPLSISYDDDDDDGEFVACKFEFKLGLGLNLFEFQLKVPFPLKKKKTEEEKAKDLVAKVAADAKSSEDGVVTRSASHKASDSPDTVSAVTNTADETVIKDGNQFFKESVKVWVKVA